MAMNAITLQQADKLPLSLYRQKNVCTVAKALLGKILVTRFEGKTTAGRIVETEAYAGVTDRASHAWNGRRTERTEVMYAAGGVSYVYLCYGIHYLFNVVTNEAEIPHAVLIRSLEPVYGVPAMLARTGKKTADVTLTRGPGNVSKAMGIHKQHTGLSLLENQLCILDDGYKAVARLIGSGPRIGVEYAREDALLPYRFYLKGNPYLSGPPSINR
jgi:DNA-3-methyladenine glycosylase